MVDSNLCQKTYYPVWKFPEITEDMFCAGTNENHACEGDSGGPVVDSNGELVGLVSWGAGCKEHVPSLFTNVVHYREWIELVINHVEKEHYSTSEYDDDPFGAYDYLGLL